MFCVAAFTDWLDGYLARLHNLTSTLGRNLDPLVDKLLMCGCYIFLLPLGTKEGWLLPWMVSLIVRGSWSSPACGATWNPPALASVRIGSASSR